MARKTTKRTRRTQSPVVKAKLVPVAMREDKTLAELAQQFDVQPNQITEWKKALRANAAEPFDGKAGPMEAPVDLKMLHAPIGQLSQEQSFNRFGTPEIAVSADQRCQDAAARNVSARVSQ